MIVELRMTVRIDTNDGCSDEEIDWNETMLSRADHLDIAEEKFMDLVRESRDSIFTYCQEENGYSIRIVE